MTKAEAAGLNYRPHVYDAYEYMTRFPQMRVIRGLNQYGRGNVDPADAMDRDPIMRQERRQSRRERGFPI